MRWAHETGLQPWVDCGFITWGWRPRLGMRRAFSADEIIALLGDK
jgi:hypothetical protein